jgi:hypothetical protein
MVRGGKALEQGRRKEGEGKDQIRAEGQIDSTGEEGRRGKCWRHGVDLEGRISKGGQGG